MTGHDLVRPGSDASSVARSGWAARYGWILLLGLVLGLSTTAIIAASHRTSPTFDEIVLMAGGARGYETGRFDLAPDHPPLLQYILRPADLPVASGVPERIANRPQRHRLARLQVPIRPGLLLGQRQRSGTPRCLGAASRCRHCRHSRAAGIRLRQEPLGRTYCARRGVADRLPSRCSGARGGRLQRRSTRRSLHGRNLGDRRRGAEAERRARCTHRLGPGDRHRHQGERNPDPPGRSLHHWSSCDKPSLRPGLAQEDRRRRNRRARHGVPHDGDRVRGRLDARRVPLLPRFQGEPGEDGTRSGRLSTRQAQHTGMVVLFPGRVPAKDQRRLAPAAARSRHSRSGGRPSARCAAGGTHR